MEIQGQGKINVSGKIRDYSDNSELVDCSIYLVTDNYKIEIVSSDVHGNYSLSLLFNKHYKIFYTHNGYVQKHLYFNTSNFPKGAMRFDYDFHLDMQLFENIVGIDWTFLDEPLAKFAYDSTSKSFNYEKSYTTERRTKITEIFDTLKEIKDNQINTKESERSYEEFSISGNIKSLDEKIFSNKAYILIYKNDVIFRIYNSSSTGDYTLTLPYQSGYQLYYSSVGYVSKNMIIDLRFPSDSSHYNNSIKLNATLFKRKAEIDYSLYEQPFRIYQYRELSKVFNFNKTHSRAINKLDSLFLLDYGN